MPQEKDIERSKKRKRIEDEIVLDDITNQEIFSSNIVTPNGKLAKRIKVEESEQCGVDRLLQAAEVAPLKGILKSQENKTVTEPRKTVQFSNEFQTQFFVSRERHPFTLELRKNFLSFIGSSPENIRRYLNKRHGKEITDRFFSIEACEDKKNKLCNLMRDDFNIIDNIFSGHQFSETERQQIFRDKRFGIIASAVMAAVTAGEHEDIDSKIYCGLVTHFCRNFFGDQIFISFFYENQKFDNDMVDILLQLADPDAMILSKFY